MLRIGNDQRRARLGRRHLLAEPAGDPVEVTRALVALHSSDPVTVYLSVWARMGGFEVADLEDSLYRDRTLIRFFGMRRTLWVVPRDLVAVVHHSSTRVIGERERPRTVRMIEEGGVAPDGGAWLDEMAPKVLAMVRAGGEVLARDLTRLIPELSAKLTFYNKAGRVMGTTGMTTRTLTQLALESKVMRTRPLGTWVSSQYRWADTLDWLGGPIEEVPVDVASAELVRRWLLRFGPGTENDIKWWTGWPLRQVRQALADLEAMEVELDDNTGYIVHEDSEDMADPGPWVALLPSLDPTTMGWKDREWYLDGHGATLFDSNGNAGNTVWVDGRVVGGWAQRDGGTIVYELLEDVGSAATEAIAARAAALEAWLGDTSITARFRSPHDKRLSS